MTVLPRKWKANSRKNGRHPARLLSVKPLYATDMGAAYAGDALELIKLLPSRTVNAIITSPPYALHFKKSYGNPSQSEYVDWFITFVQEFRRVLRPNGSLVIEIGGAWNRGEPTRSIYHFELLVRLVNEAGFCLAEEFFWYNRARMPSPAEWVKCPTNSRERCCDTNLVGEPFIATEC
jgi:site-specific DNA-methyltransferase (cytosine-N4-specific)